MTIEELKSKIDATINSNGKRLITGAQLNEVLNAIATYTEEVDGNSLKIPQFLPFDSVVSNADVQVGSTSATDYEIVYVESKNVFTAYTGGVYYTDWVGSLSYNKGTFSKSAIATNLYINPYAEIYKIENSKLVAIQKYDVANVIATYGDGLATLSYKGNAIFPETKGQQVKMFDGSNVEDAIKQNGSNIVKEKERAQQVEMYLESQKADKYGYYENLSVGVSDNLSGRGEATESEFSFRPSGGENKSIEDGTARINTIKGNSVVYNQLSQIISLNIRLSNDTSETVFKFVKTITTLTECNSHKLYVVAENDDDIYFVLNIASSVNISQGAIITCNIAENVTPALYAKIPPNTSKNVVVKLRIVDLTKMFNGVNVPTTVEEFEALYGNMPNEYNEGTIIDNHTTAIKSVGVNAWDEEWEDGVIDNNGNILANPKCKRTKNFIKVISGQAYRASYKGSKITSTHLFLYRRDKSFIGVVYNLETGVNVIIPSDCEFVKITFGDNANPFTGIPEISLHLVHTGYLNGKYFPYESQTRQLPTVEGDLKSAGTAYDEIRYNKGKDKWEYVKRVGSVDLGSLEWKFLIGGETSNNRFATLSALDNAKAPAYGERPNVLCAKYKRISPYEFYEVLSADLGVGIGQTTGQVILLDKQYNNDVVALKASLQGVILYYELAKPVVTELDVDISPDYKVWDYGTEEAISEVLSTPVRINANYGFNAVGQITDNTELIKELLARVAVLEAQIAQANSANVEPIEPVVE